MAVLCDDIISLILEKTTLRTLLRCKCLCKRWLNLASDEHLSREVHVPGLIVRTIYGSPPHQTKLLPLDRQDQPRHLSLRLPGGDDGLKIVASGKGFLFCVREGSDGTIGDDCYLYNPFTREYAVVPRPTRCWRDGGAHMLNIGLALDLPKGAGGVIVSAFPIRTGDPESRRFGFEIYSLALGEWRVSHEMSEARSIYHPLRVIVCQTGAIFWNSLLCWSFWSSDMLQFDPVAETSKWARVPSQDYGFDPDIECIAGWLGEIDGDLVFALVTQPGAGILGELFMFVMAKGPAPHPWYYWPQHNPNLGVRRQLDPLPGLSDPPAANGSTAPPHVFHPVGLVRRSGGEVMVVFSSPCGKTGMFDVQTGSMEMVLDVMMDADALHRLHSDPTNPYPFEPQYYDYFPTTKAPFTKRARQYSSP